MFKVTHRRSALLATLGLGLLTALPSLAQEGPNWARGDEGERKRHHTNTGRGYMRGATRITVGAGATLYNGDLTKNVGLSENFLEPAFSLGFLYRLSPHFQWGGDVSYLQLGAKDYLPARNYAFQSKNGMLNFFARYNFLVDPTIYTGRGVVPLVIPFVQAGFGAMLYKPKAYIGPERLEDYSQYLLPERNDYPTLAGIIPVGVGATFHCTKEINLTLQGDYYFTSSDNLDDVSLRGGNPDSNDGFGVLQVKLEYKL